MHTSKRILCSTLAGKDVFYYNKVGYKCSKSVGSFLPNFEKKRLLSTIGFFTTFCGHNVFLITLEVSNGHAYEAVTNWHGDTLRQVILFYIVQISKLLDFFN